MELDIVVVFPVSDRQVGKGDIGCRKVGFKLIQGHPDAFKGILVRNDKDFAVGAAAYVDHRDLRKLLYPPCNDVGGEFRKMAEIPAFAQAYVHEERRDVGGACLEDFRAVHLRQRRHRAVDFFVGLDVKVIDIPALFEGQGYRGASVFRFRFYALKMVDLHQALPQGTDDCFVESPGGHARIGDLDCHIRDIHIRNEGDRKFPDSNQSENDEHQQDHGDGDGPVQQLVQHSVLFFDCDP